MDIIFAIDRTCFSSQLSTIKSFLRDLIDRNYFPFNSYFGFVVSNEAIKHWRNNTNIKNYINILLKI